MHACRSQKNKVIVEIPGRYGYQRLILYDPGAFDDRPYIAKLGPAEQYYEVVIADSFVDEYNYLVKTIRETGRLVDTHYGLTREILFTHIVVLDPEKLTVPQTYPPRGIENILDYCRAFVTGVVH